MRVYYTRSNCKLRKWSTGSAVKKKKKRGKLRCFLSYPGHDVSLNHHGASRSTACSIRRSFQYTRLPCILAVLWMEQWIEQRYSNTSNEFVHIYYRNRFCLHRSSGTSIKYTLMWTTVRTKKISGKTAQKPIISRFSCTHTKNDIAKRRSRKHPAQRSSDRTFRKNVAVLAATGTNAGRLFRSIDYFKLSHWKKLQPFHHYEDGGRAKAALVSGLIFVYGELL